MDFSSGNSGNTIFPTVTKIGPECAQEGAFCQYLGEKIAPKIYSIIPNGYVMELLQKPDYTDRYLLQKVEKQLRLHIWNRPAIPISTDKTWIQSLEKFGVVGKSWYAVENSCLVHGDPTLSNTLLRGDQLIIADPRPPRDFVPQSKETDMGRILQSFFGWEHVAYGWPIVEYYPPEFWYDLTLRKRAEFWAGAAAARIEYQELSRKNSRKNIIDWCNLIRRWTNV